MELAYIFISTGVFGLLLLFLYIAKRRGVATEKASTLSTIAMLLVMAGMIVGNGIRWYGYALLLAGIIAGAVDLIRKLAA